MNRLSVLPLLLLTGLAPATTLAQASPDPAETTSRELHDCAVIQNGVARLACYDEQNNPQAAREQASDAEIEAAEQLTDRLDPDAALDTDTGDTAAAVGDQDDSGVMDAVIDRYVAAEKAIFSFSGAFVSHRPTYILPFTWVSSPNQQPTSPRLGSTGYDYDLDNKEAKYQISFKVPLLTGLLDDRTTLWFGYTQASFWQVYNRAESAPFRETNYEPELFVRYRTDWKLGPGTLNGVTLGFSHQSNGQSEPRSRSWNRIIGSAGYSYDRWLFMVQPWYRLPEGSDSDDNADLDRYVGYADFIGVYKLSEDKTLSLKLRNNFRSEDNKTSFELGYSFPMGGRLKGFIQYYNGYAESLIDYNKRVHRFGIGVMLNDWL